MPTCIETRLIWTPEEEVVLKELAYEKRHKRAELIKLFPGRSYDSVRIKLRRMGLEKRRWYWTENEKNVLKTHIGQRAYKDMAQLLPGRTSGAIAQHSMWEGLEHNFVWTIHDFDHHFWSIPTPLNSYVAGFIAADGHLCKNVHGFQIALAAKDMDVLHRFKSYFKYTGDIRPFTKLTEDGRILSYGWLAIYGCKQWYVDLERNFGVVSQKTYRIRPPNLDSDYLRLCFLMGYMDGDGSITVKKSGSHTFTVCSCSLAIIEFIKEMISKYFPLSLYQKHTRVRKEVRVTKRGNCHILTYVGIRAMSIVEALRGIDVPRLARKWDRPEILADIERKKKKHPQVFGIKLPTA